MGFAPATAGSGRGAQISPFAVRKRFEQSKVIHYNLCKIYAREGNRTLVSSLPPHQNEYKAKARYRNRTGAICLGSKRTTTILISRNTRLVWRLGKLAYCHYMTLAQETAKIWCGGLGSWRTATVQIPHFATEDGGSKNSAKPTLRSAPRLRYH